MMLMRIFQALIGKRVTVKAFNSGFTGLHNIIIGCGAIAMVAC